MKNIFLLIAVLTCTGLFSQKNKAGIFFSPDVTHRTLKADGAPQLLVDVRNNTEISKWGFTAGANYERKLNNRLWLTTGLLFTDRGYQTRQIMLTYIGPQPNPPYQFAISTKYNYYQLGVPLGVSYYFLSAKKTRFFVNGGAEINFLLKIRTVNILYRTDDTQEKRKTTQDKAGHNLSNISATIAFGIERDFKGFSLRVFPRASYALTSYYTTGLKMYPYSIGLGIGVYKVF